MRSRTALIGRAVGDGEGVGAIVAVAGALAATVDGDALGGDVVPPHEATTIASTAARRRITSVYRCRCTGAVSV